MDEHPAGWRSMPLRVRLPWPREGAGPAQYAVPVGGVQRGAHVVARILPWVLVVLGALISVVAAVVIERDLSEAAGGLGVEVGAALWFAGAITIGARSGATVGRFVGLVVLALSGAALVAIAVLAGWSGAALDLALEYGVGAVAVAVIDVVLLGLLHSRLEQLGSADRQVVTLSVQSDWPWVTWRSSPEPTD